MPFSTWSREFGEHKRGGARLAILLAGAVGPPLVWLTSLEAAFILGYPACWTGTRTALLLVALSPIPVCALLAWLLRRSEPVRSSAEAEPPWSAWLATFGLVTCAFFVLVAIAMVFPIAALDPCKP